jgi:tellurite methyltransferase
MIPSEDLRRQFGDIDIYLFDQLQRGRFDNRRQVLDAGCGAGRNLVYLLRAGFTIFGVDRDPGAIAAARSLAAELAPALPAENFRSGELDALPWPDLEVDAVICSAVLHFARDTQHFDAILSELWRVLAPGGLFFARLASVIGLEVPVNVGQDGRTRLPDGSDRFVVTEAMLHERSRRFGASQLDPLKTTNVQNQRCMTTWVLMKPA